ncbi:hypothetical protein VNO77_12992 [Canavalia gladiata]|uniref:Uncharacterized protein n=1 Tax=Canavalia gladiata TaxID=3824 RepID=A0AAN9LWW6_CANGL
MCYGTEKFWSHSSISRGILQGGSLFPNSFVFIWSSFCILLEKLLTFVYGKLSNLLRDPDLSHLAFAHDLILSAKKVMLPLFMKPEPLIQLGVWRTTRSLL